MDHDQHLKVVFQEFLEEFFELFFAVWADRFDFHRVEWLEKEIFPNAPAGPKFEVDLLAKVALKQPETENADAAIVLVHIEIDSSDRTTRVKPQMPLYYIHLRHKYQLPVLPIVIYLKVGKDGLGVDTYVESVLEFEVLRFAFLYVGLPGLDALEYLDKENWLSIGLSSLMRIPKDRIAELGAEALRKLAGAPLSEGRKFLLAQLVEAYLPLDETEQAKLQALLGQSQYEELRSMNATTYERGIEKGEKLGEKRTRVESIEALLEVRFESTGLELMPQVRLIDDLNKLRELQQALRKNVSLDQFRQLLALTPGN